MSDNISKQGKYTSEIHPKSGIDFTRRFKVKSEFMEAKFTVENRIDTDCCAVMKKQHTVALFLCLLRININERIFHLAGSLNSGNGITHFFIFRWNLLSGKIRQH